ncbi:hypothetical protein [Actinoplanes sp. NPDC049265]|uniref:hypothetical protein n=1 Tax=Actinoplanes sp. NPDC049265 TaxID=3363902 RepID=UPI003710B255
MDNELYIVALIKSSDRARTAIGEVLGDFSLTDLLRRVGRPGQSAGELAELALRVRAEFAPAQLPAHFGEHHLRLLVVPSSLPVLADTLRCSVADVHANLLDPHQLGRALRDAGHVDGGIADAELMLLNLMPRLARLAAAHALEPGNWGSYLERRGWITPSAIRKLAAEAERRSWPSSCRPTQILAAILEQSTAKGPVTERRQFDALALIEVRRRVGLLAEKLREDASAHAEEAALLAPELSSVARLPAWLQLYERDAVAIGLHRLFTGSTSLAELLQGTYAEPPTVTGDPRPDVGFQIINDLTFGTVRKRIAFDVTCVLEGETEQQVVLRCRGLPRKEFEPIRDKIVALRTTDVSAVGASVGTRLLNTQMAERHGLRGRLRHVLRKHGAQTIQCILLAGIRTPVAVPPPWHDYLRTSLPYAEPPSHDARFAGPDQINHNLRAELGDRPVEVVR